MKKVIGAGVIGVAVLLGAFALFQPSGGNALSDGPRVPGAYGPLSASDANRDGEVVRAEMEEFVSQGPERRVGMVAYFDQYDTDYDGTLTSKELDRVDPPYAFDGSDLNADGVVTRVEVETYVSERLYRQMSLLGFFDLIDTNANGVVTEEEMIAAQDAGQLPVEDI